MPDSRPDVTQYTHIANLADPQGMYQMVQEYIQWMAIKNYSQQTINGRELFLFIFLEWAGQRGLIRPSDITKPILERFQRYLFHYRKKDGNPLSFRSQYNRLAAIRAWFKWLSKENHLLYNPASEIELPKLDKRLPKAVLSESEAERVLNEPDVHDAMGLRDRAILETLYSTGIRRMELTNLAVQDVDADRGTPFVRQGKGRRDRMIPIGERALQWIEKYLEETRPELCCGRDGGIHYLNRFGEAITPNGLTTLVRRYIKSSNIGKKGSCHLFRHTMATLMLENRADIRFYPGDVRTR
ncbi:site-specific tyrosine recombinase XerC [Aliikangiella maris]|uniref:Site-specific tyrosine recombinase XerC n=2 Tax=Aliikangiella maris TaxID=3162458 RepID=A0ABV2BZT9_9GAMM